MVFAKSAGNQTARLSLDMTQNNDRQVLNVSWVKNCKSHVFEALSLWGRKRTQQSASARPRAEWCRMSALVLSGHRRYYSSGTCPLFTNYELCQASRVPVSDFRRAAAITASLARRCRRCRFLRTPSMTRAAPLRATRRRGKVSQLTAMASSAVPCMQTLGRSGAHARRIPRSNARWTTQSYSNIPWCFLIFFRLGYLES